LSAEEEIRIPLGEKKDCLSQEKREKEASSHFYLRSPLLQCMVHSLQFSQKYIQIEDGSLWNVKPSDAKKLLYWSHQDPIVISQSSHWFSFYRYEITNISLQESVEAELFLGPFETSIYTCFITAINYAIKTLSLSNGTYWQISWMDDATFLSWRISDAVIIGKNSSFGPCGLLINVNTNNFARAENL
jgi:hypothetical protein